MQIDPICGKKVEGEVAAASVEFKKRRYYFCSAHCQKLFEQRAERSRIGHLAKIGALLSNGKVRWGLA
ncbi:MAG: YHS domain-containing protein [Deltaproteobacteria bacterium]